MLDGGRANMAFSGSASNVEPVPPDPSEKRNCTDPAMGAGLLGAIPLRAPAGGAKRRKSVAVVGRRAEGGCGWKCIDETSIGASAFEIAEPLVFEDNV
jgi:hypothetical protein